MKLHFILGNTIFNCDILIQDTAGKRSYQMNQPMNDGEVSSLAIEVYDEDFEITLIPVPADLDSVFDGIEEPTLTDRIAKAAAKKLFSGMKDMALRVGCTYRVRGSRDGDVVYINEQEYIFDTYDRFDILGLIPMMYCFYEIHIGENRGELTNAFETNRKEVISFAKKFSLLDFGLHLIIVYPLQVGRIKRLSKNKKVFGTLLRFHNMTPEKRQRMLEKMEKFLDN